jgi:DNA-binding Lrp family transcriptional regulator
MKERQGFQKLHHNCADTSHCLSPRAFQLLVILGSNSATFHPTNHNLSERLKISVRAVQYHLYTLENLGLLLRQGKAIRRGHARKICLTAGATDWLRHGTVPSQLKPKVSHEATCTSEEFLKEECFEENQAFKKKVSHEAACTPKEEHNKQAEQAEEKVALLASLCDEESFELPPAEPEKPERTEMACNALSHGQTSNHTQNERKSRGEPVKGLPEALANKVAQYQADELWKAIESAGLNLKSTLALYELALEKNVTPAEFKTILAKALARQPYNLGGLLNTLLKEDVYGMRARHLKSEKEVFFDRRKAHAKQAIEFCDSLGLTRYTSGERNEYLYIPKFCKYIALDVPNEELIIELQGLKQQHG